MKPIMLATDGSPSAEAATDEAIELARALATKLIVVSVEQAVLPTYGAYYGYAEIAAELRKTEVEHVAGTLAGAKARAAEAGVDCETVACDGPVADELCRIAHLVKPRVLVIGAHGWGWMGRMLHGSVSTHVLHHAPCPVLVVLGDGPEPAGTAKSNGAASRAVVGGSTQG